MLDRDRRHEKLMLDTQNEVGIESGQMSTVNGTSSLGTFHSDGESVVQILATLPRPRPLEQVQSIDSAADSEAGFSGRRVAHVAASS